MLISLLMRILLGERYRKATPRELRWYGGFFLFLPIWMALFVHFGGSFLDRAGAVGVWFYGMGWILIAGLVLAVWAKFVPALVSWILGAIVWIGTLSLALTRPL